MKVHLGPLMLFALTAMTVISPEVPAYGGGSSSSSSCSEAKFYSESPAKNAVLPSLNEFSLVASDNTDTSTLELQVNGTTIKPEITPRRSGEWELLVRLPEPITQNGKVRISLVAKSKEGCSTFYPYYLEIKP